MKVLLRLVFLALAALLISYCTIPPNDKDIEDLKHEGEILIERINEYAEQNNGNYPVSLEAVGIEAPETRWGRWRYYLHNGRIVIEVGDYGRDGFILFWDPVQRWYLDT